MLDRLRNRPNLDKLETYLRRLRAELGDDLDFVVLYGSMARGDFSLSSDFDLLIGLRADDGLGFLARLDRFFALNPGGIQPFPYTSSELSLMESNLHLTLLEACADGVILEDSGTFAAMRERHDALVRDGAIERLPDRRGWRARPGRRAA